MQARELQTKLTELIRTHGPDAEVIVIIPDDIDSGSYDLDISPVEGESTANGEAILAIESGDVYE